MPSVCIWMSRRTADAAGKNCGGVMNKTVLFSLASKHSQGGFLIWIPSPDNHLTTQSQPRRLELKADHSDVLRLRQTDARGAARRPNPLGFLREYKRETPACPEGHQ